MAFAQVDDVSVRWARTPSEEENDLIAIRLSDIERIIRKRIPDLDDRILSGDLDVDDVIQVEADSVLRLVRNHEGFVSETDGNYTYQFNQATAAGKLEILPEEWALLGATSVGGSMFELVPNLAPGE